MSDTDTISAHTAIEIVLSNRVANEPGFLERALLDPAGTVAEIAAEVAETDDIDLSGVSVSIHVQTPKSLHFVLDANPESEVAAFAFSKDLSFSLDFAVRAPVLGAKDGGSVGNNTTTHTPCHTNACPSKVKHEKCGNAFRVLG